MQDGHQYDAPETDEDRKAKSVGFAVLGILVAVMMIAVATGTVQVFNY